MEFSIKKSKLSEIDTLVISGGGVKSISQIGGLIYLQESGVLNNITQFAGSSAGSILCTLLVLGYNVNEITQIISDCVSKKLVTDFFFKVPFNLFNNYGIYSGTKLYALFEKILTDKGFAKTTTFLELYQKTQKILVITGTSINKHDTFYFNYLTFPDMKITDALRISTSIPLFFTCPKLITDNDNTQELFVDGGLFNNFPLYYFDIIDTIHQFPELKLNIPKTNDEINELEHNKSPEFIDFLKNVNKYKTLGLMLTSEDYSRNTNDYFIGFAKINSLASYLENFIEMLLSKIEQFNFINPLSGESDDYFDRTITIKIPKNISATQFNIDQDTKNLLINIGYNATKDFFI